MELDPTARAHARDGLLAGLALAALLGLLVHRGATGALARPAAALVGTAGAVLVELAFLRMPELGAAWERPAVSLGGLAAVLVAGAGAYLLVGPAVVAALCWGLAAFLALLAAVAVTGRNPLARVAGP